MSSLANTHPPQAFTQLLEARSFPIAILCRWKISSKFDVPVAWQTVESIQEVSMQTYI